MIWLKPNIHLTKQSWLPSYTFLCTTLRSNHRHIDNRLRYYPKMFSYVCVLSLIIQKVLTGVHVPWRTCMGYVIYWFHWLFKKCSLAYLFPDVHAGLRHIDFMALQIKCSLTCITSYMDFIGFSKLAPWRTCSLTYITS